MAFVQLRNTQIKDETLKDNHIAPDAAINESKLNVAWDTHYHNALKEKKVVDYVQVNTQSVLSGSSQYDLTSILSGNTSTLSDATSGEGIITDAPKNKIVIRDNVTGDPFTTLDANGVAKEVYGRLTYTPDDTATTPNEEAWTLYFYYEDATGAETSYAFGEDVTIDLQYAKRFNLDVVDEMFAANEKFVEGAADSTAHLNIQQLAKDLYTSVSLDRDGNANLGTPLETQITDEVNRATAAEQAIRDDLASTTSGKGAGLIGVVANTDYSGSTVQAVLDDLGARLTYQEENGGAEVTDTHTREATTTNGYYIERTSTNNGEFVDLEARLEDIENVADAEFKKAQDTTDEVVTARGADTSLDARLDRIEAESASDAEMVTHNKETGSVGVESGGAVNAQSTPDMTVAVDANVVYNSEGQRFAVAAGNGTITAADGTYDRIDVVTIDNTGAIVVVAGTASSTPTAPSIPSTSVALAEVYVPTGDTAIEGTQITDVRTYIATDAEVQTARDGFSSLDARLDDQDTKRNNIETYIESESDKFHVHKKHVFIASGGETTVDMPTGEYFQIGDDTLDVFVNGALQAKSQNYTEIADANDSTKGIGVDFGTEQLASGDVIVLKYQNNNTAKTFA